MNSMNETTKQIFQRLITVSTVSDLDPKEALLHIGKLIDVSGDLAQEFGWAQALRLCDDLEPRLSSSERVVLHYFRGNASAGRHALKWSGGSDRWVWEMPEIGDEILHLRRALQEPDFPTIEPERRCQIFTNLANAFNHIGRFVEALEYWTNGLKQST
jgi:hypothetical protein